MPHETKVHKKGLNLHNNLPQVSRLQPQAEQPPNLPPPPLFTASKHINNSLRVYLFHCSELHLEKSKEFDTQEMKVAGLSLVGGKI